MVRRVPTRTLTTVFSLAQKGSTFLPLVLLAGDFPTPMLSIITISNDSNITPVGA